MYINVYGYTLINFSPVGFPKWDSSRLAPGSLFSGLLAAAVRWSFESCDSWDSQVRGSVEEVGASKSPRFWWPFPRLEKPLGWNCCSWLRLDLDIVTHVPLFVWPCLSSHLGSSCGWRPSQLRWRCFAPGTPCSSSREHDSDGTLEGCRSLAKARLARSTSGSHKMRDEEECLMVRWVFLKMRFVFPGFWGLGFVWGLDGWEKELHPALLQCSSHLWTRWELHRLASWLWWGTGETWLWTMKWTIKAAWQARGVRQDPSFWRAFGVWYLFIQQEVSALLFPVTSSYRKRKTAVSCADSTRNYTFENQLLLGRSPRHGEFRLPCFGVRSWEMGGGLQEISGLLGIGAIANLLGSKAAAGLQTS